MVHNAPTDHGMVLRSDQSALVLDADGGFRLLLAQGAEDAPASRGMLLIAALAVKLNDPDLSDEFLEVFAEAHRDLR